MKSEVSIDMYDNEVILQIKHITYDGIGNGLEYVIDTITGQSRLIAKEIPGSGLV